jgi:uncharacterized protein YbbC (DUF1343 family)
LKKSKVFLFVFLLLPVPLRIKGQGFSFVSPTLKLGNEVLISSYLDSLKTKRVGLLINHTAILPSSNTTLLQALLENNIPVTKIFAPEHGYMGDLDAGENFTNQLEPVQNIPIINLYQYKEKIPDSLFQNLDLILYDIQDVGTRFYTYVSLLCAVIQAASRNNVEVWVLDRPNPNLDQCDGPILDTTHYRSYTGLHPVPIAYGLTIGEYIRMAKEKGWLGKKAKIRIIPMENFHRNQKWEETGLPWIPPSPNLKTVTAARLYPAFGWFEGTLCSVGRGTDSPFQLIGLPFLFQEWKDTTLYSFQLTATLFTPTPQKGAKDPKYKNIPCYGFLIQPPDTPFSSKSLFLASLSLLHIFYQSVSNSDIAFFNSYFNLLAGNSTIQKGIIKNQDPENIYASWSIQTTSFCLERKRYFLYPEQ